MPTEPAPSVDYIEGVCAHCGNDQEYIAWNGVGQGKVMLRGVSKQYAPYCSFDCREDHFRGQNAGDLRRGAGEQHFDQAGG